MHSISHKKSSSLATMTLIIFVLMVMESVSAGKLTTATQCKQIQCLRYEFCSMHESLCRPCVNICTKGDDFYDMDKCEEHCEDFIHDKLNPCLRMQDVPDILRPVYGLMITAVVLLFTLITLFGGTLTHKWYRRYKKRQLRKLEDKKFQQKLSAANAVQYTISNTNVSTTSREESARCTLPIATIPKRRNLASTTTLTTQLNSASSTNRLSPENTLPLSNEEPCEDDTLDYASYVNQALSQSSSNEITLCSPKY